MRIGTGRGGCALLGIGLLVGIACAAAEARVQFPAGPSFARDVRPILQESCLGCHNARLAAGGLVLETYDGLMRGGKHGAVVVPGHGDQSRLVQMIEGSLEPRMPLQGELKAEQIAVIRAWVEAGAGPPPIEGKAAAVVPAAIPEVAPRAPVAPPVAALAFRPDGALLAAGGFRQVLIVDPATGLIEPPLGGPAGIVRALAFSPDGRLLAAGGGDPAQSGEAQLWDLAGPSVVKALETRTDAVYSVAFGPDGRVLATSSYDRTIKLWAVPGGREIATLREHTGPVYAAAFSPDGRHLVSASGDATAKIWEVPSGRRVATLSGAVGELYTAVFRPGGREIAVGGEDGWLRIWTWDGTHAELRRALRAHRGGVARCAYSGDGAILVSAGSDNVVKSWSSETLAELRATGPWPHPVAALAVSPDGRTIALGGTDGAIVVLEAATGRQLFATRSPAKRTW